MSWSGHDDPGGSGINCFDVYVSDDDGDFTLWQYDTTDTSATFTGVEGHTYSFYCVAFDNAGNAQPVPMDGQAMTTVASPLTITAITPVSPNPRNAPVTTVDVTFSVTVDLATFTPADLTLTDNGGPNLINAGVSISLVSGSNYKIGGLTP